MKKEKNVLISVFDKNGISAFAKSLNESGYKIIATEGTGKELAKNNIPYISTEKLSKNPNGLEDCIKTISFRIEAGILFDRLNKKHLERIKKLGIKKIDMVVCNVVNFDTIKKTTDFNIKNIDVGGPLMIRAAATSFRNVLVVVDPKDYKVISKAISKNKITNKLRQTLAAKAFAHTRSYDSKIVEYLKKKRVE